MWLFGFDIGCAVLVWVVVWAVGFVWIVFAVCAMVLGWDLLVGFVLWFGGRGVVSVGRLLCRFALCSRLIALRCLGLLVCELCCGLMFA